MTIEDKPVNIMASNQTTGISVNLSTGEVNAGTVQFRNRIINGDMRIAQRGTSTTTSGKTYLIDRFSTWTSITTGVLTTTQNVLTSSDEPYKKGFLYSNKITVTTAVSSYAWVAPVQIIEGTQVTDFQWGTSNGSPISLSLWFKSNSFGTHTLGIRATGVNTTTYNIGFIVSTSNWQYVSFTIPPPPVGTTWNLSTVSGSLEIYVGVLFSPTKAEGWTTINSSMGVTGSVNWPATLNNFIEFTGVQLEKGSKATPFEFRPFAAELQLCQRYFMKTYNYDVIPGTIGFPGVIGGYSTATSYMWCFTCPTALRTNPSTITAYAANTGTMHKYNLGGGTADYAITYFSNSERSILLYANANGQINNYYYVHLTVDSEL